jgi:surface protein
MNGRQQLIEQIRQQSIEKRAQALREAAQRQFSNAPIAGASSFGGGRKAQCLPLGGVMLSINFGDGAYNNLFLTESGTLNEQPQYLVLLGSEGNGQFFVRISWTGSEWALGQVLAINGTIDGEQDFAFSPTLLSSAWPNGQDIEYVTTPGEEFDCSWRHCFAVSGDLFAATLSLAAAWIGIPLTEAPNAYTSAALGAEGFNIFWDEKSLGWIIEGPDEGDLSLLPGGTREQLPIGQFAIFDDLVLAISSGVCTFAPPLPPLPSQGFIFRVDTLLGDGNASFVIPTSGSYTYDYTATWTSVSDPSVTGTETGLTGTSTINFPFGGQYDIEITGLFPAMEFNPPITDAPKVTGIIQWGSNQWQSTNRMFFACSNLSLYLVTDLPDLGGVTSMNQMFDSATSFNGDISGWDVSSVTDMDKMFDSATSFNRDLSGWCVSGISPQPPGFDASATAWILPRPNWGSPCLP